MIELSQRQYLALRLLGISETDQRSTVQPAAERFAAHTPV